MPAIHPPRLGKSLPPAMAEKINARKENENDE
jgi:hypothetical protein